MFVKETSFRDLPEHVKQKLILLNSKLQPQTITPIKVPHIEDYSDLIIKVNSLPTENIKKSLVTIAQYLEEIKKPVDLEQISINILKKVKDLENMSSFYEYALSDPSFLKELKETYLILSGRVMQQKSKKESVRYIN